MLNHSTLRLQNGSSNWLHWCLPYLYAMWPVKSGARLAIIFWCRTNHSFISRRGWAARTVVEQTYFPDRRHSPDPPDPFETGIVRVPDLLPKAYHATPHTWCDMQYTDRHFCGERNPSRESEKMDRQDRIIVLLIGCVTVHISIQAVWRKRTRVRQNPRAFFNGSRRLFPTNPHQEQEKKRLHLFNGPI